MIDRKNLEKTFWHRKHRKHRKQVLGTMPMEFSELQQIVESNSRAIQAMLDAQETERLMNEEYKREAAEERSELRQAMIGIANLLSSLDSDRPTILRKLNTIEGKVDRLLERTDEDGESQQV